MLLCIQHMPNLHLGRLLLLLTMQSTATQAARSDHVHTRRPVSASTALLSADESQTQAT